MLNKGSVRRTQECKNPQVHEAILVAHTCICLFVHLWLFSSYLWKMRRKSDVMRIVLRQWIPTESQNTALQTSENCRNTWPTSREGTPSVTVVWTSKLVGWSNNLWFEDALSKTTLGSRASNHDPITSRSVLLKLRSLRQKYYKALLEIIDRSASRVSRRHTTVDFTNVSYTQDLRAV